MKIKNSDIVNFLNLNLKHKKLPIKVAFAMKLNSDKMQPAALAFNEAAAELKQKYRIQEETPVSQDFVKAFNELLEIETDINIDTVTMEELEKTELLEFDYLTLEEIAALSFMVQ